MKVKTQTVVERGKKKYFLFKTIRRRLSCHLSVKDSRENTGLPQRFKARGEMGRDDLKRGTRM